MSSPQPLRPTKELEDALAEFQDLLSDEQKAQLEALTATTPGPPSPDAVLLFTAQVDTHNARRKSRCVASRISGLLESVQQFTAIVDTFVSSRPTIAALVWGGLKVFILAASNFSTFFDELTTCFMNVQRLCPRYGNYEFLYKDSLPLQQSLCTFYTSLIRFCTRAMSFLKREGFLQLAKSFFTTFQSEFGVLKKEMERNSEDVERWLRFASDRAADEERQQLRKWRSSFHIFSDKDREWKFSQGQRIRKSRNGRILDRLSNFDHRNALKRLRKKRFQNPNGLWLTQTTQYQEWLQKDGSSVFMLSGKMGSGKSVLSAAIVDDILLQQLPTNCLRTFFFCEHDNARSLTARTILGSLMRQCIPLDEFPAMLETDLYELLDNEGPNGDSLGSFLVAHSDVARTHIIMIDGLDECSEFERQVVFATFNSLLKLSKPRFKFFLSGRDDIMPDVHEQLQADFRMTMSCPAVCNDIEAVIDASLNEKQRKRKLVVQDSNLLHHVRAALISGAHGM
jgi:archaellum biogenesis ATPase FlaH